MGINARALPPNLRRLAPDSGDRPKPKRQPAQNGTLPPEVAKVLSRGHLKYRNVPTIVDGIRFDSAKEASRYKELAPLARAGKIARFRVHTRWRLVVNDLEVGVYESDFDYQEPRSGLLVVEDVKSDATRNLPTYRLKKKLMLACYGITIQEI